MIEQAAIAKELGTVTMGTPEMVRAKHTNERTTINSSRFDRIISIRDDFSTTTENQQDEHYSMDK